MLMPVFTRPRQTNERISSEIPHKFCKMATNFHVVDIKDIKI